MSWQDYEYGPADDYMSIDSAIDDGWLPPDEAEEALSDARNFQRQSLGLFILLLVVIVGAFA